MPNKPAEIINELQRIRSVESNTIETLKTLHSAITTLSKDLYGSESHYLYELIQNADDNKYKNDVVPELRIELKEIEIEGNKLYCLILVNNEKGFSEEDVRAICDIDESTKAQDFNTIGEKGIGFKSVFRITDCPYIFSNGFNFKLPEKNPSEENGLGYIIPYNVDYFHDVNGNNTVIILPLNKDKGYPDIAAQLLKLNDHTILFLRKLKTLEIKVDIPGSKFSRLISRRDEGSFRFLEVKSRDQISNMKYFVFEKNHIKPENISHLKRTDVEERIISIAIPLRQSQSHGVLFSYLPVWEDTGLPFMVNSDFLLTTDRENLHMDYEWNKWLRDEIASDFIQAFIKLLNEKNVPLEEKIEAYNSIPTKTNVSFLTSVVTTVLSLIREENIILSFHTEKLHKPTNVFMADESVLDLFIHSKYLPEGIKNDEYPLVSDKLNSYQLKYIFHALKIKSLSIPVFSEHYLFDTNWMVENPNNWFISLYEYLRSTKDEDLTFGHLKILKLEGKTGLYSSEDTNIYFKIEEKHLIDEIPENIKQLLKIDEFNQELLNNYLSLHKNEKKLWLHEKLGIWDFSKSNLGTDLLNLINEENSRLRPDAIIQITEQIVKLDPSLLSKHQINLVLDDDEIYNLSSNEFEVVVPVDYNLEAGWQHLFIEGDRQHFKVISDKYSKEAIFSLLNGKSVLKLYPSFKKNNLQWNSSPLTNSGKDLINQLKKGSANEHYFSLSGFEFTFPMSFSKLNPKVSNSIIEYLKSFNFKRESFNSLEINKEQLLSSGLKIQGIFYYNGRREINLYSSICNFLKTKPWLYIEGHGYQIPTSVFIDKAEIREIFGDSVPYIKGIYNAELIDLLGFKDTLTRESLLKYLEDVQKSNAEQKIIAKIYTQLDQRTVNDNSLKDLKIVFVPASNRWVNPSACIWEDPKEIDVISDTIVLSLIYPDSLKSFFVQKLGVSEKLSIDFYLNKYISIQEGRDQANSEVLKSIYRRIKTHVINKDLEIVNSFLKKAKVFSQNKKEFFEINDVYFADDINLKKIFKETIPLAFLPEEEGFAAWIDFYKSWGVKILSQYVSKKLDKNFKAAHRDENQYFTISAIKLIASFIKTNNAEGYQRLLESGFFGKLINTKEYPVKSAISVDFYLENQKIISKTDVFIDFQSHKFYYQETTEKYELAKALYIEINKLINIPKEAKNSFELYLGENSLKRKERDGLETPKEVNSLIKEIKTLQGEQIEIPEPADPPSNNPEEEVNIPQEIISEEITDHSDGDQQELINLPSEGSALTKKSVGSEGESNLDPKRSDRDINDNHNGRLTTKPPEKKDIFKLYEPDLSSPYEAPKPIKPKVEERKIRDNEISEIASSQIAIESQKKRLENEDKKIEESRDYLFRKSRLLNLLNQQVNCFKRLKILTELEYLYDIENSMTNAYNFTFNKIEIKKDVIHLDFPNKYISPIIEQYENLTLVLYTESITLTLSVKSVSINKYLVRAKLWKESDIEGIQKTRIVKAVLKIEAVDFLWKTVLDQLYRIQKALNIGDHAKLPDLIKYHKISFIFGPPGTGKTSTIINDHLKKQNPLYNSKILVLTPTNKAADVITERLIKDNDLPLNFFRFGNTSSEIVEKHKCFISKELNYRDDYTIVTTIARFPYDELLFKTRDQPSIFLRDVKWNKIIIDEASMVNLAQIFGLILSVDSKTDIVIVGDPFQIKPILNLPEWEDTNIYDLLDLKSFDQDKTKINNFPVLRLMKQYRSLTHIGTLYSDYSYNGKLEHARGNLGMPKFKLYDNTLLKCLNIIKFPIKQDTTLYSSKYLGKSSYHLYLALFLIEWLLEFVKQFDEKKKIGIVTPYRAQSDLIYKLINVNYKKLNGNEVQVSTIHGFQGDECDIIICAFNPPISKDKKVVINDKNVINVAISRAKDHLILFIPENFIEYAELKTIIRITQNISNNNVNVKDIEKALFQSTTYFETISYATAHHPINVFGSSDYKYEIRIEDEALDIQINEK